MNVQNLYCLYDRGINAYMGKLIEAENDIHARLIFDAGVEIYKDNAAMEDIELRYIGIVTRDDDSIQVVQDKVRRVA